MFNKNDLMDVSAAIDPRETNVTLAYIDKSMIRNSREKIFSLLETKSCYIKTNLPTKNIAAKIGLESEILNKAYRTRWM